MREILDCQSCGACCVEAGDVVVGISEPTPKYLTRSVRGVMGYGSWEADEVRRMAKHLGGRCKALRGTVGEACRCGVYDRRPAVCRQFEPGSESCLLARETMANKLANSERSPRGYGVDLKAPLPLAGCTNDILGAGRR